MRQCYIILIVLTGYLINTPSIYGQYVTKKLESMANAMNISFSDTTKAPKGCDIDSTFYFKGYPLHIKKNQYGEICHIGYSFFSKEIREKRPLAIYDFLERYLLELDLLESKEEIRQRLFLDNVIYEKKTFKADPDSIIDGYFKINFLTNHKYEIEWKQGTENIHIAFNADCQLILGAAENELEKILLKKLQKVAIADSSESDIMLILDRYGYEKDTLGFNRQKLIDLIEEECEESSLRNKSETEEVLFAINHQLGFIHLVSFKPGQARMYAYISIHNVPDSFIDSLIPIYKDILIELKTDEE